ncbi:MAG: tetrahydrofolate synthase [Spirochaetaceae bacterium]|jgi:dihydrofolate synthase/folylpolyglutamate synthase|nr:tetrahydrofolate synthase [Spirochaetaceae bacterium]
MAVTEQFESSGAVFDWLGQFVNLEQGAQPPMRSERMDIIARAAGNPERCAPAIHVAGSKGKGSVTAMASEILTRAGKKVARYLSPHIVEYRERITLNDAFFDEATYVKAGQQLRQTARLLARPDSQEYAQLKAVSDGLPPEPTFFELLTLYYFLCAKEARVDALAVETGMGGRLDPTNIAQSLVSVITVIELEHTDMLGATIAQIAGEKAGIIKHNRPLILAEQTHREGRIALDVFVNTARERNAPLYYFPQIAELKNIRVTKEGARWTLIDKTREFFDEPLELSIKLPGEVQARNTSLAIFAVRKAYPETPIDAITHAVAAVSLPARFETILTRPPVIVDGAHTDISVKLCAETFTALYGEGGVLLFGCAMGKDAEAMARTLVPHFSTIIITTPGSFKISQPENVYTAFTAAAAALTPTRHSAIELIKDTTTAIQHALDAAQEQRLPLLGTGSFYLAAEIRNHAVRAHNPPSAS